MKIIKYDIFQSKREDGTDITSPKEIFCYTQEHFYISYTIAEMEAIEGSIEVTGEFDDVTLEPTQLDRIEAQVAYNSIMLGTLMEV